MPRQFCIFFDAPPVVAGLFSANPLGFGAVEQYHSPISSPAGDVPWHSS